MKKQSFATVCYRRKVALPQQLFPGILKMIFSSFDPHNGYFWDGPRKKTTQNWADNSLWKFRNWILTERKVSLKTSLWILVTVWQHPELKGRVAWAAFDPRGSWRQLWRQEVELGPKSAHEGSKTADATHGAPPECSAKRSLSDAPEKKPPLWGSKNEGGKASDWLTQLATDSGTWLADKAAQTLPKGWSFPILFPI